MEATNACALYLGNTDNVIVERNIFHNLKAGNCAAIRADGSVNKLVIANNLFYACESGGGQFSYHDDDGAIMRIGNVSVGCKIVNNTCADNANIGSGKDNYNRVIALNIGWASGEPLDVRNNIFSGNEEQIRERPANIVNFRNNEIVGGFTTSQNSGTVLQAPNFVNSSNPIGPDGLYMTTDDGYRIQSSSACINAGLGPDVSATDIAGIARIQGTAVDIGAYECSGGTVSLVHPGMRCGSSIPSLRTLGGGIELSGVSGVGEITILRQNGMVVRQEALVSATTCRITGLSQGCYIVRVSGSATQWSQAVTVVR